MTSAQSSNTEEVMCCSPESGFGSEIQYSPTDIVAEGFSSVQNNKLNASKNLESLFHSNTEDYEQSLIKIVDVKSLAVNSAKSCTAKPKANSLGIIQGTKRLCLRKNSHKKVLVLDSKLVKSCVEPVICSDNQKSLPNKSFRLAFSGLPVISRRLNFELSQSSRDQFVLELLSKEDKKKLDSSPDTFLVPIKAEISDVTSQFDTDLLQSTSQSEGLGIKTPRLTVYNLHTQKNNTITSGALHSNSVSMLHKTETKSYSPASKHVSQTNNSKAEKIKRLKEIMAQKERNLQKVRKNCGFIS